MYVRVKRHKTTIFLSVEPTETILECKEKIQSLLDISADTMRLYMDNNVLDDMRTLAELKVENDCVIGLSVKSPDGSWEEVLIETPFTEPKEAPAPPPPVAQEGTIVDRSGALFKPEAEGGGAKDAEPAAAPAEAPAEAPAQ